MHCVEKIIGRHLQSKLYEIIKFKSYNDYKLFKPCTVHPYKIHHTQELCGDDYVCKIQFLKVNGEKVRPTWIIAAWVSNNSCWSNFLIISFQKLFSDESFTFHEHLNRENCKYWSQANPECMRKLPTKTPEKINVLIDKIR